MKTLTPEQENEVIALKRTLPFRICFGAINPQTGEFITRADYTKHAMNRLLRAGWFVSVATTQESKPL